MSCDRRPWYPWYPRDFVADEKVKGLSDDAELLYRRALDVMWQANALQLPNNCTKLAQQLARGWSAERFKGAWEEIQYPGFELLKETEDGLFVYSERLKIEAEKIANISKKRSKIAKARQLQCKSSANVVQLQCHTDTDTYIKENKKKKKFEPPTEGDVVAYFAEKGYSEHTARKAWSYYETAGWKDSRGQAIKNWKQKMIGVWFKDENKAPVDSKKTFVQPNDMDIYANS